MLNTEVHMRTGDGVKTFTPTLTKFKEVLEATAGVSLLKFSQSLAKGEIDDYTAAGIVAVCFDSTTDEILEAALETGQVLTIVELAYACVFSFMCPPDNLPNEIFCRDKDGNDIVPQKKGTP